MNEYTSDFVAIRIKGLLKSKKMTASKMLEAGGINKNGLFTMQDGYLPRLDAVAKMADYLDCSVDYLLGRTDNPEVNQ